MTTQTTTVTAPLEAADIMRLLPHRYPFLLVDRVIELEPGKRAVALKAVTANEPQFTGHFPDRPIMPGVLQIEALAQAAGGLGSESFDLAGSSRVIGVAALVIDEDLSRDVAVEKAHRAFHQEVEAQLKALDSQLFVIDQDSADAHRKYLVDSEAARSARRRRR